MCRRCSREDLRNACPASLGAVCCQGALRGGCAAAPPPPSCALSNPPFFPVRTGLDAWQLAAVEQLTSTCKSLVIATALLHGRLSVRAAIQAARLEEDYQLEDWGMVEAGHDLDIADINTRIAAPSLMLRLLSMQQQPPPQQQPL